MARSEFGGVMAAWIVQATDPDEATGAQAVILPAGQTDLTIYDAPNGAPVTDLLDETGAAISGITVPAGSPYIPRFSGPDGVTALWVQAEGGQWLPLPPYETTAGGGGGGPGDVILAGGNVYEYPDSQSPPWLVLRRPNDNSPSSGWSNMWEFHYFDATTSQYQLGFYINEKGLGRVRGTTPSDVPFRTIAHPSHGASTSIFEVTLNDPNPLENKLLQFLTSQAVFRVPVIVPYLVNPIGERLYWGTADPNTDPAYAEYRPDIGAGWVDYNNPPGA